jgi:hypothetical protein
LLKKAVNESTRHHQEIIWNLKTLNNHEDGQGFISKIPLICLKHYRKKI